jgi:putative ABC transport system ATP-binding protein
MEGRAGAEYVVVGAEGVVHLPAHIARDWPQGTLVRIEPEPDDRLLLSRGDHDDMTGEHADPGGPAGAEGGPA